MADRLVWRGKEVERDTMDKIVKPALVEFCLRCEARSKMKLRPSSQDSSGEWIIGGGRGKRTGTLQRSIHIAEPGYIWTSDDVRPGSATPERGGHEVEPGDVDGKMTIEFGSGLEYAIYVHQLHYDEQVNHFLTDSVEEERPNMPEILSKHARRFS